MFQIWMSSASRWTLKCSFTLKLDLQVVGKCPYLPPGGFWKHLYCLLTSCTPQRLTSWSNCKEGEDSQGLKDWNMAQVCYKRLVLRKKKSVFVIFVFNGQKEKHLHNSINTPFDSLSFIHDLTWRTLKWHYVKNIVYILSTKKALETISTP